MPDGSTPVREEIALSLSSLSSKDKSWDVHRALASQAANLYTLSYPDYADRMRRCALHLGFALEASSLGEFNLRLREAQFCRVRHCPICQGRRSSKWQARFFGVLPRIKLIHPSARWIFLTLTVRNVPLDELRSTVAEMNLAWGRMVKRKAFPAIGWVKSLEVTRNASTGEAHPHFHCLLMVPPAYFGRNYINQGEWRQLWQEALRVDYLPVVNVKVVKGKKDDSRELARGALETLKYTIKPEDLVFSSEWLEGLTQQLHKTRSIAIGGVLKEFLSEEDPEDLIYNEGEKKPSDAEKDNLYWFTWREEKKKYLKELSTLIQ